MNSGRTKHVIVGHFNPRCMVCGLSVMDIQRDPTAPCTPMAAPVLEMKRVDGQAN